MDIPIPERKRYRSRKVLIVIPLDTAGVVKKLQQLSVTNILRMYDRLLNVRGGKCLEMLTIEYIKTMGS